MSLFALTRQKQAWHGVQRHSPRLGKIARSTTRQPLSLYGFDGDGSFHPSYNPVFYMTMLDLSSAKISRDRLHLATIVCSCCSRCESPRKLNPSCIHASNVWKCPNKQTSGEYLDLLFYGYIIRLLIYPGIDMGWE